eukprot:s7409_g2.t1
MVLKSWRESLSTLQRHTKHEEQVLRRDRENGLWRNHCDDVAKWRDEECTSSAKRADQTNRRPKRVRHKQSLQTGPRTNTPGTKLVTKP